MSCFAGRCRDMGRRGLSLVEVVMAMWLLLLASVLAFAVLHRTMKESRRAEHATRAAYLAQQKMESLMAMPLSVVHEGRGAFAAPFEGYHWTLSLKNLGDGFVVVSVRVEGPSEAAYMLQTQRRAQLRRLWFASNRDGLSQLYRVGEDGQELERMTQSAYSDSSPAVSPDGTRVAFVSNRSGRPQIYVMAAQQSSPAWMLVEASQGANEPAWRADGKALAYTTYDRGYAQVFVVDLETRKHVNVTDATRHVTAPAWSPDGRRLAVVVQTTDGSQIATIPSSGGLPRTVTRTAGWNAMPCFSPDGRRIAFMSNRDGNPELYTVDPDGERTQRVTVCVAYDGAPRFSSDGKKLLFWSERGGLPELYVANPDGTAVVKVIRKSVPVRPPYFEKDPSWEP